MVFLTCLVEINAASSLWKYSLESDSMALLCSLSRNTGDWTMLTNKDIDLSPKIRHGQELPGIVVVEIRLQGTISFK